MPCDCILVVEDDDSIRFTLKLALELEGYEVRTAEHGRAGLEALRHMNPPCLILLDLMMPVMDGWEFADTIAKDLIFNSIPVVVITAYFDKTRPLPRARSVIKKPVELEALFENVGHYCNSDRGN